MPETASSLSAPSKAKRGALTGAALSDEVFDSSPSLLRPARGNQAVAGLQQFFAPPEVAGLIAGVNGRRLSTLDLTAGNGALRTTALDYMRRGVVPARKIGRRWYSPRPLLDSYLDRIFEFDSPR